MRRFLIVPASLILLFLGVLVGMWLNSPTTKPISVETINEEFDALETADLKTDDAAFAWANFAHRLKFSDHAALAAGLAHSPTGSRRNAFRLVMASWAEANPKAAWDFSRSLKSPVQPTADHAVLEVIARTDPHNALALADTVGDAGERRRLRGIGLRALVRTSPAQALAIALDTPDSDHVGSVLHAWAKSDPEAAKSAVSKMKGSQGSWARSVVLRNLVQRNPRAAWAYAEDLQRTTPSDFDPRLSVIQEWTDTDPKSAFEAALGLQDQAKREEAVSSMIYILSSKDFQMALDFAASLTQENLRNRALYRLADSPAADYPRLLKVLLDLGADAPGVLSATEKLFSKWAKTNPREAAEALKQLPSGDSAAKVTAKLAGAWAGSARNPREVFDWINSLPPGPARDSSFPNIFESWASVEPLAAAQAWASLPQGLKQKCLRGLGRGWSENNAREASHWIATRLSGTEGSEGDDFMRISFRWWARSSPRDAADFAATLPEADRVVVMSTVMEAWGKTETDAAEAWIRSQPSGPATDRGLVELVTVYSEKEPSRALELASLISKPDTRAFTIKSVIGKWKKRDAPAADNWVKNADIPENLRRQLVQ